MTQSDTTHDDTQRGTRRDVFLSYASADRAAADAACAALEAQAIPCWIAPRDITPAQDWSEAIIDAIAGCRVFLLVLSPASNLSEQVKRELQNAVAEAKFLLPLRIAETALSKHMRYFIGTPHWLDALEPPLESHLGRLVETVRGLLDTPEGEEGEAALRAVSESSLPTGTVTFLFTDIEGSTQLWERQPEAMRAALARHDEVLRGVIGRRGGVVFKTVGDSFYAAFVTAPSALEAALEGQRALGGEPWPGDIRLRVRMALHTGAAEERDGDYFGPALNRVARLLAAGHGGQTLVSASAQSLLRDALPPGAALLDLGVHQLRDLERAEPVFQLAHPDLPDGFPLLKGVGTSATLGNLPQQLTSFIGREPEVEAVKSLLGSHRLVTLTGAGGCGKTRLSLQVAGEMGGEYPDGAWLVELAPIADPALVPSAVAQALGVREQAGEPLMQTLPGALRDKRMLVVLDNCEHLLPACAALADALLRACPRLTLLGSSREALGIAGEQTYRVPSLSVPDARQAATVESLGGCESVRLFLDRAALSRADFRLTGPNAPALASVCRRLDGIPLAIELAAARVRSLSVEEIDSKLDSRFRLLTGGSRTALPRQQTLRALIDWSYSLLNAQEKRLLDRLAVFAGGWTLDAAEQVCIGDSATGDGIEDWEVLDLLVSLVDKSVAVAETQEGKTRYRLLETVRQYAQERLLESGEADAVRARHRDWCLSFAEQPYLQQASGRYEPWCQEGRRLVPEYDNLRAAFAWCRLWSGDDAGAPDEETEADFRLSRVLFEFWVNQDYLQEGRKHLGGLLGKRGRGRATRARLYAFYFGGRMAVNTSDRDLARALLEEALAVAREAGDRGGEGAALHDLAWVASAQGDRETAHALAARNLALCRELGDPRAEVSAFHLLGLIAEYEGDYAAAYGHYAQCLERNAALRDECGRAWNLHGMGFASLRLGDYDAARALLGESLRWFAGENILAGRVRSVDRFAELAAAEGQPRRAVLLFARTETLRAASAHTLNAGERTEYDRLFAGLRAALGEDAYQAAWAEGSALTLEQAVALALEG